MKLHEMEPKDMKWNEMNEGREEGRKEGMKWTGISLTKWNEMTWNGIKRHDMKWNEWRKGGRKELKGN